MSSRTQPRPRHLNAARAWPDGAEYGRIIGTPYPGGATRIGVYIACAGGERAFQQRMAKVVNAHPKMYCCTAWSQRYDAEVARYGDGANQAIDDATRKSIFEANRDDMRKADQAVIITSRGNPRDTFAELGWFVCAGRPVTIVSGERLSTFGTWEAARVIQDDAPAIGGEPNPAEIDLFARVVISVLDFARRYPA